MSTGAKDDRPQEERGGRKWGWMLQLGFVVALLAVVASYLTWRAILEPAPARKPFIGTWRLESPVFPKGHELAVEVDLLPDGIVRDRVWNPQTGAIEHEQVRPGWWDVSDGRFREFM